MKRATLMNVILIDFLNEADETLVHACLWKHWLSVKATFSPSTFFVCTCECTPMVSNPEVQYILCASTHCGKTNSCILSALVSFTPAHFLMFVADIRALAS